MAKAKVEWMREYTAIPPDRPVIYLATDEGGRGLWALQEGKPNRLIGWFALESVLDAGRKQGAVIAVRTDLPPLGREGKP